MTLVPLFVQIIWQKRKITPWLLEKFSNDDLDGPNKCTWFLETIIFVSSTYLLAYVIPQVRFPFQQ